MSCSGQDSKGNEELGCAGTNFSMAHTLGPGADMPNHNASGYEALQVKLPPQLLSCTGLSPWPCELTPAARGTGQGWESGAHCRPQRDAWRPNFHLLWEKVQCGVLGALRVGMPTARHTIVQTRVQLRTAGHMGAMQATIVITAVLDRTGLPSTPFPCPFLPSRRFIPNYPSVKSCKQNA